MEEPERVKPGLQSTLSVCPSTTLTEGDTVPLATYGTGHGIPETTTLVVTIIS